MKNEGKRGSRKSINDEDINFDELLKENKNKKTTDVICGLLNYFSLIPTLIYNIIWFFYFRSILENLNEQEVYTQCPDMFNWNHYALNWVIISFFKALFFLCFARLCCGDENDCNMICLLIKSLTSLVPAIIFTIKMPDHINAYRSTDACIQLENTAKLFYKCEYIYVLFILILICFVPFLGAFGMGLKEYLKSRSYKEE